MERYNELKAYFGFDEKIPIQEFWKKPSIEWLPLIAKALHTPEMLMLAIENDDNAQPILRFASKRAITPEVSEAAVRALSLNLRYVPNKLKTYELCLIAVQNDHAKERYNVVLKDVPEAILNGPKGLELCEAAICANGLAAGFVPQNMLTKELLREAIINTPDGVGSYGGAAIEGVAKHLITKDIAELSVQIQPSSIVYVPESKMSKALCLEAVSRDGNILRQLSEPYRSTPEIVDAALAQAPELLMLLGAEERTKQRCRDAVARAPRLIGLFSEETQKAYGLQSLVKTLPKSKIASLKQSLPKSQTIQIRPEDFEEIPVPAWRKTPYLIANTETSVTYDLTQLPVKENTINFYYVTDVHLEHQVFAPQSIPYFEQTAAAAKLQIDKMVEELISSVHPDLSANNVLLVGGDVACSFGSTVYFYEALRRKWVGTIVSILGNHELWDCRMLDESKEYLGELGLYHGIVDSYKKQISDAEHRLYCLENELLVCYRGINYPNGFPLPAQANIIGPAEGGLCVVSEKQILETSRENLTEFLSECAMIILGGIGFAGLNPKYNADLGLYRGTVDRHEEIALSERFEKVYEKVMMCASKKRVVVLTHMAVKDWTTEECNPNWVYVNGHTHRNMLIRSPDGITVFADNQIGYKVKRHRHLNKFTLDGRYDPFATWEDGVYTITPQQYMDFNRGRGITMDYFKRQGQISVMKRAGVYMFFFNLDSLPYILRGGQLLGAEHDAQFYWDNLEEYANKTRSAFGPYRRALEQIANEIRSIGGTGNIHGCIVDFDLFNHIFLNPYDGSLTPYFALDTNSRKVYDSVHSLLTQTPFKVFSLKDVPVAKAYEQQLMADNLPLLSSANVPEAVVSPLILEDREMYSPSRVFRSIQYLFDQGVIRIWSDDFLFADDDTLSLGDRNSLPTVQKGLPEESLSKI